MALSTEEAAVNAAATAYLATIEALIGAASANDIITFVPVDVSDSADNDHSHAATPGTETSTFSVRVPYYVRANGEYPIQIPAGHDGSLVPLVWFVTNSADDLS